MSPIQYSYRPMAITNSIIVVVCLCLLLLIRQVKLFQQQNKEIVLVRKLNVFARFDEHIHMSQVGYQRFVCLSSPLSRCTNKTGLGGMRKGAGNGLRRISFVASLRSRYRDRKMTSGPI